MNTQLILTLRSLTGAGMQDCQKALEEAGGSVEKAAELLRKKGMLKAAGKQAERTTKEGFVGSYVHSNGKVASMVALACETDFVARNEDFKTLARELAMHVTAANPQYLNAESVPADVVEKEKEFYREELKNSGKPEAMWETIMGGKLQKFYSGVCLLNQLYIKDDSKTIEDVIKEAIAKIGEKIEIKEFKRISL